MLRRKNKYSLNNGKLNESACGILTFKKHKILKNKAPENEVLLITAVMPYGRQNIVEKETRKVLKGNCKFLLLI